MQTNLVASSVDNSIVESKRLYDVLQMSKEVTAVSQRTEA